MLSKNEVNYIQSLYHKKQRLAENLFIVEGKKIVNELIQSQLEIKIIYATKDWINESNTFNEVKIIEEFELKKISSLQSPNQVIAIVKIPAELENPSFEKKMSLVIDGIQDPGNFGTIIRIADWFGIENIICSNDSVDVYNSKTIQSTMGSFLRTKIFYKDLELFLQNANLPIFGAYLNGIDIRKLEKPFEGLIIIGNEGNGIRKNIEKFITRKISIEKIGKAESLNAAVATGIIISHLV